MGRHEFFNTLGSKINQRVLGAAQATRGFLKESTHKFFHKPDLSEGDDAATRNRYYVYNELSGIAIKGTILALPICVLTSPDSYVAFMKSGALLLIATQILAQVSKFHLEEIQTEMRKREWQQVGDVAKY